MNAINWYRLVGCLTGGAVGGLLCAAAFGWDGQRFIVTSGAGTGVGYLFATWLSKTILQ